MSSSHHHASCDHDHHGHHHHHHHGHHHHHHQSESGLGMAFALNLLFTIIEIIGGYWTNSVAILTDALHDFGDSLSLGFAWYLHRVAKRKSDQYFSYGYQRFNVLGALITGLILLAGSVLIIIKAVPRLIDPQTPHAEGMMLLAILGVVFNGAAVLRLQGDESINTKMVALHLMEDVLGWAAVLVGSIFIYFFNWPIIDPIMSLGIAVYILFNAYKGLRYSVKIILQAVPSTIDIESIREEILTHFPQIQKVQALHVWTMDGQYHVMTLHLVLAEPANKDFTQLSQLKQALRDRFLDTKVKHLTIEFELPEEAGILVDA
ncbi:MAG: cation diffusion facilitator family transporter [Bacteroidota bacterium]